MWIPHSRAMQYIMGNTSIISKFKLVMVASMIGAGSEFYNVARIRSIFVQF
jgi:hypothetical protein